MTDTMTTGSYGEVVEPATLKIERILPGPIDRVWDYLTKSDLRRQWLASGDMAKNAGADFELTWRNDELTNPPGKRPEGFGDEHTAVCRLLEYDPPHILSYTFGKHGEVTFTLTPQGKEVLLTLVHRRMPDPGIMAMVGPGWHAHLDILVAKMRGLAPEPFWDSWGKLKAEYAKRLPK
ncbi:MAG TPA: SRPBCC family protein [Pseudolabrys sp.]|nr:SRPBCC family protein [Pseudolabrys sp.]